MGVAAAMLFSVSFVMNRRMDLSGGSWEWTASLRYLMMLPALALIVAARRGLTAVLAALRAEPVPWLIWSTVGFGFFYAPMALATTVGPAWLLAGAWQLTILAGIVLAPLLYRDQRAAIPRRAVAGALVVLSGVALLEAEHARTVEGAVLLMGILLVLVAAFSYPAGNRMTMELAGGRLDTWQRMFAMTLASLPFWLVLAIIGLARTGPPSPDQLARSAIVAAVSGVLATALFFAATARVRHHPARLATVEATQSVEVVSAALLETLLVSAALPSPVAWTGIAVITAGIVFPSFARRRASSTGRRRPQGATRPALLPSAPRTANRDPRGADRIEAVGARPPDAPGTVRRMLEDRRDRPDFTLRNQDGEPVTLSSLRDKPVVVHVHPKAGTPR